MNLNISNLCESPFWSEVAEGAILGLGYGIILSGIMIGGLIFYKHSRGGGNPPSGPSVPSGSSDPLTSVGLTEPLKTQPIGDFTGIQPGSSIVEAPRSIFSWFTDYFWPQKVQLVECVNTFKIHSLYEPEMSFHQLFISFFWDNFCSWLELLSVFLINLPILG